MISFSQFLFESEFEKGTSGSFRHSKEVHGHRVNVIFGKNARGHYEVAYHVNGSLSRDTANMNDAGPHILKHVDHTVNKFIQHKKPKSLTFSAADASGQVKDAKNAVYHKSAERLAKRYGGTHTMAGPFKAHTVHFDSPLMKVARHVGHKIYNVADKIADKIDDIRYPVRS